MKIRKKRDNEKTNYRFAETMPDPLFDDQWYIVVSVVSFWILSGYSLCISFLDLLSGPSLHSLDLDQIFSRLPPSSSNLLETIKTFSNPLSAVDSAVDSPVDFAVDSLTLLVQLNLLSLQSNYV